MGTLLSYAELELYVQALDPQHAECLSQVGALRMLLEDAYASRVLTLHQWRALWEEVSVVQARASLKRLDAWRYPMLEGNNFTYIPPPPIVKKR
jgi:hypothetical protein